MPVVEVDVALTLPDGAVTVPAMVVDVPAAVATGVVTHSVWGERLPVGSCATRKFDTPVSLIPNASVWLAESKNSACCP
jgi:hypothetical protein